MRKIIIDKPFNIDFSEYKGKIPTIQDYDEVIREECQIYEKDKLICTYKQVSPEIKKIIAYASANSTSKKSQRTRGTFTQSTVFGALPRVPLREDYCRFSADTKQNPKMFHLLSKVAQELWDIYKTDFPEMSQYFEKEANLINKDWVKTGTPFSTININKGFAIKYHVDAGNMANVFSNVIISKRMAKGGYFVMPQYRIALAQDDGWLAIVDGVNVMHGVTPIEFESNTSFRNSFVFYTLKNLKQCECKPLELSRMKNKATERALKRLNGDKELKKLQNKRMVNG
jgi:hypothetical protein